LAPNVLTRLRKTCLALPEAYEKVAWNAPTFRVKDRQFAMFVDDHHGDGVTGVWCKAAPGVQEALIEADPERFFRPPYVGPAGWIGIRLDRGLDWRVVAGLVREGYLEVAPKKLRETLIPRAAPRSAGPARATPARRPRRSPAR
jgi:hypothetical protein